MDNKQLDNHMRTVMEGVESSIEGYNPPFAALLLDENGKIINKSYNTVCEDRNHLMHAEVKLLLDTKNRLGIENFSKFTLICNAASCPMCTSAALKCQIKRFVFGAPSPKKQNPNVSMEEILESSSFEISVTSGVLESECQDQIDRGLKTAKKWWE